MNVNFDFKKQDQEFEAIMEKKSVMSKISTFKIFPRNFRMNFSLDRIHPGVWSVVTLLLGVLGMHYKIDNAAWVIPVGCILYYAAKHVVPFAVMLVSLLGMALGIPQMALLLIFSVITMVNWSAF